MLCRGARTSGMAARLSHLVACTCRLVSHMPSDTRPTLDTLRASGTLVGAQEAIALVRRISQLLPSAPGSFLYRADDPCLHRFSLGPEGDVRDCRSPANGSCDPGATELPAVVFLGALLLELITPDHPESERVL